MSTALVLPRYPIYIPSKNRADVCLTAKFLTKDGVPFKIVVEPQERETYAVLYGADRILTLPHDNGHLIYARNWIKRHAIMAGYERHWQLDDNIREVWRWFRGKRIPISSGIAFAAVEDFVDRYQNIALAGLNYEMFGTSKQPPFHLNCRVYSCTLVNNAIPHRWRIYYNDDTDMCLQVLADGWCTVLVNAFLVKKMRTMTVKGGNTEDLYQGDGRLRMARSLERMWPGVVETKRRFHRPQHVINWSRFDTPLKLKEDIDLADLPPTDEYGMKLEAVKEVKSERLKTLLDEYQTSAN